MNDNSVETCNLNVPSLTRGAPVTVSSQRWSHLAWKLGLVLDRQYSFHRIPFGEGWGYSLLGRFVTWLPGVDDVGGNHIRRVRGGLYIRFLPARTILLRA